MPYWSPSMQFCPITCRHLMKAFYRVRTFQFNYCDETRSPAVRLSTSGPLRHNYNNLALHSFIVVWISKQLCNAKPLYYFSGTKKGHFTCTIPLSVYYIIELCTTKYTTVQHVAGTHLFSKFKFDLLKYEFNCTVDYGWNCENRQLSQWYMLTNLRYYLMRQY